jgi:hypothetical protein
MRARTGSHTNYMMGLESLVLIVHFVWGDGRSDVGSHMNYMGLESLNIFLYSILYSTVLYRVYFFL